MVREVRTLYATKLRRRQGRLGDTWFLDEVFVTIRGQRHYLWRAVDQDGDVIDILVQRRRDARAARRFFRKLLKGQGREPRWLVTDKLGSYGAAHRSVMPSVEHVTTRYANNLARGIASADPAKGAADAQVQVRGSSAAILVGTRGRPQSLQPRQASIAITQLPVASWSGLCGLDRGCSRIVRKNSTPPVAQISRQRS